MKNMTHIAPLYRALFENRIFWTGFAAGRSFRLFNYCSQQLPELAWDINLNFPFNPKNISKLKDRKLRKAAYQSFALYKSSFKSNSTPKPDFKVIVDEWSKGLLRAAKKINDAVDAISYTCANLSWGSLKQEVPNKIPDYAEFRGIKVPIDKGTKQ